MTKKTYVIYLFIWAMLPVFCKISAQNTVDCSPGNCLYLTPQPEAVDSQLVVYAQNQWSIDEWDNALGCAFFDQCENLRMLVYYPHIPPGEKRPLVLLIHGGGFISGDYRDFQAAAKMFAGLGYVAATIDYRLCKRTNCQIIAGTGCLNLCNGGFLTDFVTGAYVATVDAGNAVRFLQQHAAEYRIDPDRIIVGGHSAGAWTALNLVFWDQDEANTLSNGWQGVWGPLQPVSGIRGVFDLSGATIDTSWIDPDEKLPVFLVHGTCDPTICYDYDAPFHCNSSYPKVFGSNQVANRLKHLGFPFYFFSGQGMGHDVGPLYPEWSPELIRFMKNSMLCDQFVQKHTTAILSPDSPECTLLSSDLPGCDLQYNHGQLPVSQLEISALWGGPTPPCGNGLTATGAPAATLPLRVSPTIATEQLTLVPDGSDRQVSIFNNLGQAVLFTRISADTATTLPVAGWPSGLYRIVATDNFGNQTVTSFVKVRN